MTALTAGSQLTSIGEFAFAGCDFIEFPKSIASVTEIKQGAFSNCTALTAVMLPNTVTELGASAFANCTGLISATISEHVKSLPAGIFDGDEKLKYIKLKCRINGSSTATNGSVFKDCASDLSVVFLNQTANQVRSIRSIADDESYADADSFGLASVKDTSLARFYTSDNKYAHPMFIYMPDSKKVLVVHSPAFDVDHSGKLLSVDPVYEQTTISSACLSGISGIAKGAFKNTRKTQSIWFQELSWASANIDDDTFSTENAGSVNQLHFDDDNCPEPTDWNNFFKNKLGSNSEIKVIFKDGYAQGKDNIVLDNDPFIYIVNESGKKVIVGVNDTKVENLSVIDKIPDDYSVISADAFSQIRKILQIKNFGNISEINDYAFRAALTLSSITL